MTPLKVDISSFCFLLFYVVSCLGHPLADIHAICERYTQCRKIATLDERLCLGNTRNRPFWLEPRNYGDTMARQCYEALKPYYKQLDKLESEQSQQLLSCLIEQAGPINVDQRQQCHWGLLKTSKYDYSGDLMGRIPTNCFRGIEVRIEKECGALRDCCTSVESCGSLENSEVAEKIKEMKEFIKDYGKRCQLGLEISKVLSLNEDGRNDHQPQPNGNITVRFNTQEEAHTVQSDPKQTPEEAGKGRILVRVITAEEELERLREAGDDKEADKLQYELEKHLQKLGTEALTSVELSSTATMPTTTVPAEDLWSTKPSEHSAGFELATVSATASVPESSTGPPSTTFSDNLVTGVPEVESTSGDQDLVPNRSPPEETTLKTTVNDQPKTVTTKTPFPINDILKKYAHVKTLNKLVEQFRDQTAESVAKNEHRESGATAGLVNPEKLHKFYDRWESSIKEKLGLASTQAGDPEAAKEYERLLKTLKTLRRVIYNNNNADNNNNN